MLNIKKLPGATPDEKVVLVLRRHWLVLLSLIVTVGILLILPIGAVVFLHYFRPDFFQEPLRLLLFVMGASVFFLYSWLFLYQNFIDYHLDTWIVTNRRVINIEQHGIFARTVSELNLQRVQDVTAEIRGFFHTMLDYGYVFIQTAGEQQRFEFEEVPHPNEVAKIISGLVQDRREVENK
jgi:uncharacterized membrane protein YdbT with pleckstrin-like domain